MSTLLNEKQHVRSFRQKPRTSVSVWAAELNSRSLANEVGGALKKRFASTDSTGNRAAFAAHHAVSDSVRGMTSSLR